MCNFILFLIILSPITTLKREDETKENLTSQDLQSVESSPMELSPDGKFHLDVNMTIQKIFVGFDPAVLDSIAGLIPAIILYSMFIAVTFGALATALSCISKSRFKTIMIIVGITMAVFLGFMVFRGFMSGASIYDPYVVWADVNYHMGNSYLSFIDSTGYRMAPTLQATLGMFTGTYSAADPSMLFDVDIGAMFPSIPRTDYVSPLLSLFGWFIFTITLLFFGIFRFQRREIK